MEAPGPEPSESEKVSTSEILRRACRDYLSRQYDRTGDILLDPASFFQKLARIEKILTQLGIVREVIVRCVSENLAKGVKALRDSTEELSENLVENFEALRDLIEGLSFAGSSLRGTGVF